LRPRAFGRGPAAAPIRRPRRAGVVVLLGWAVLLPGCAGEPEASLQPDSLLRAELDLGDSDQVYRVSISSGVQEQISPASVELPPGAWLEFVTTDWRVHEVRFEVDSLPEAGRSFLENSGQTASPPLVNLDQRFVVTFAGAPEARYPFVVEGNGAAARGVVVVRSKR